MNKLDYASRERFGLRKYRATLHGKDFEPSNRRVTLNLLLPDVREYTHRDNLPSRVFP